jgi:hypothetical protein
MIPFTKFLYQNNLAIGKALQSFVRTDETKSNLFFAPTSGSRKIQIGLQVWNLSAKGRQIMRAAELLSSLRQQEHLNENAPTEYFH